jgi:predicted Fe-S protein YdhL (DUF1289 family)
MSRTTTSAMDDDIDPGASAAARRALAARAAVARHAMRDVPSPCVSVCRIDAADGLCTGCLRTLDEIAAWSRMADAGKRHVWHAIGLRARPAPSTP